MCVGGGGVGDYREGEAAGGRGGSPRTQPSGRCQHSSISPQNPCSLLILPAGVSGALLRRPVLRAASGSNDLINLIMVQYLSSKVDHFFFDFLKPQRYVKVL